MEALRSLGLIVEYFVITLCQFRGFLHLHGLGWVLNAPETDKYSDFDLVNFMDTFVTCSAALPNNVGVENDEADEKLPSLLQLNAHKANCQKDHFFAAPNRPMLGLG